MKLLNKCKTCMHYIPVSYLYEGKTLIGCAGTKISTEYAIYASVVVDGRQYFSYIDNDNYFQCNYKSLPIQINTKTNQGNTHCFKCNTKTVKMQGYKNFWDICPNCKI